MSLVLDALGGVLQGYARYALKTESLDADAARAKITDWMRHATIGGKHPTREGESAGGLASRDWRGLIEFVAEHRRSEHQHAQKAGRDLRETVWSLVASAHRVAKADAMEEARRESMIDPVTQLANRKGFEEFLERTIALHTLSGEPASLLMIDMDKFKIANDTFGHDVGDTALRTVGDCLARAVAGSSRIALAQPLGRRRRARTR